MIDTVKKVPFTPPNVIKNARAHSMAGDREMSGESFVDHRHDQEVVEEKLRRLVVPLMTGAYERAQEQLQEIIRSLDLGEHTDHLSSIIGLRASNAVEREHGYTKLTDCQYLSRAELLLVNGVGVGAVDTIEKSLSELNLRLKK